MINREDMLELTRRMTLRVWQAAIWSWAERSMRVLM